MAEGLDAIDRPKPSPISKANKYFFSFDVNVLAHNIIKKAKAAKTVAPIKTSFLPTALKEFMANIVHKPIARMDDASQLAFPAWSDKDNVLVTDAITLTTKDSDNKFVSIKPHEVLKPWEK